MAFVGIWLFLVSASSTPRHRGNGHACVNSPGAVLWPWPPTPLHLLPFESVLGKRLLCVLEGCGQRGQGMMQPELIKRWWLPDCPANYEAPYG